MSLGAILNSASSGLQTAQAQLRTVSDNIANVNTTGYARKVLGQTSVNFNGQSSGVTAGQVTRSVDAFLAQASLNASAAASGADATSDMLTRAQSLFGDPSAATGYFNQLDQAFAAFSAASQNPASTVSRNQALNSIAGLLDQSSSISNQLQQLAGEASSRITSQISQANTLLQQIDQLNNSVVKETANNGDATDAQNNQDQLINSLAKILDVTVNRRSDGGVDIRTNEGTLLLGRGGPATLSYATSGPTAGAISVASSGGTALPIQPSDGSLKALLDLKNTSLPAIGQQLGEYVTQAVNTINAAHNASAAVPAPNVLTGRNTGLDLPTAISGFTGKTTVAIVDPSGVIQSRIDIDFDAGTMSADGGPPLSFTPTDFLANLNIALGGNGSASFANGALSLQASAGNGVAIGNDPNTPSAKAGRGFSQFFGLNDLITSNHFPYPETGLSGSDPNNVQAGGTLTLRVQDSSGSMIRDVTVNLPAGGTMDDFVNALNSTTSGVGLYGAYSMDANGQLNFTSSIPGAGIRILDDTSQVGVGGPTVSTLFGMDPTIRAQRAAAFQIRPDIAANSMNLSFATLDLSATAGQQGLSPGDGRGAQLLASAGQANLTFDPAGVFGAMVTTLSQYGAQFSGNIADSASSAAANKQSADSVATEADARRSSIEGVNLDQELVNLTTYQQSYNASARLITAVKDMYDTLMQMT